jgi:hypothetical protein
LEFHWVSHQGTNRETRASFRCHATIPSFEEEI